MARAISSLPTPDSPSISTGMFDLAARSARRMVRAMLSTLVTTSRNVSSPSRRRVARLELVLERVDAQRVLDRHLQPLGADRLDDEIVGAGAHRRDHRLDRAVRGLDDGGNGDAALAHAGEHAHAVEIGHHQIEHDEIDRRPVGRLEPRQPRFAVFGGFDLVAETPRHRLEQPALDRIVVDYENQGGHELSTGAA